MHCTYKCKKKVKNLAVFEEHSNLKTNIVLKTYIYTCISFTHILHVDGHAGP